MDVFGRVPTYRKGVKRMVDVHGGAGTFQKSSSAWWLSGGIDPATVAGVWQPKGAASLDASYINLADISNPISPIVAPGWNTTDGWIATGSEWLQTSELATSKVVIIRFSDFGQGSLAGRANGLLFEPNKFNAFIRYLGSVIKTPGMTSGVIAVSSDGGWRDGVKEVAVSFSGYIIFNVFASSLGADKATGAKLQSMAIYTDITDEQVLAVSTAMAAL